MDARKSERKRDGKKVMCLTARCASIACETYLNQPILDVRARAHTHTRIHTPYTHIRTHTYTHAHTHKLPILAFFCTCVCVSVCVCMCVYVCVCVCDDYMYSVPHTLEGPRGV